MPKSSKYDVIFWAAFILLGCTFITRVSRPSDAHFAAHGSKIMMDTIVSITVYGAEETAKPALQKGFKAMADVDKMASFHLRDSELGRLNSQGFIIPSASFALLLQDTTNAFDISEGYFDPTFAVLHKAYGFYDGNGRTPSDDEMKNLLDEIGWNKKVRLTRENISIASGTLLDFGGIAGGFAVEEAAAAIKSVSSSAFFIDDGGDLWMEGRKPNGFPWKVAVKDPRGEGSLAVIETFDSIAVSTSGDYERFVMAEGKKICHIMNPKTGKPADYYRSVTVIAGNPLNADILSTTLFAMEPDKARQFADEKNIPAIFLPASGTTWMSKSGSKWFSNIVP